MARKALEKGLKTDKRIETEKRILLAFERLLTEGGSKAIGVNSLVQEAGVAKGLIYKYFGGLEGVAKHWMEQYRPALNSEKIKGDEVLYDSMSPAKKLSTIMGNYISTTSEDDLAMELLSEEVSKSLSLSETYSIVRGRLGKEFESILMTEEDFADPNLIPLIMILHAASNYLALRTKYQPVFNGIDISTSEGKQSINTMLTKVCQAYAKGLNDSASDNSTQSDHMHSND